MASVVPDDLPEAVKTFVEHVESKTELNNIKCMIKAADCVSMNGLKVNGYFCDTERVLATAIGRKNKPKPLDTWLSTLVHESCHMDQYLESSRVWTHKIRGCNPSLIFDLWMKEVVELKPMTLHQMIMGLIYIEQDCERRSVKKIRKWKLPLDTKEYTQKANSYLYFYHMVGLRREWYHIGTEPYNIPEVWQAMPTDFDGDYTKLPTEYRKLFVQHCFKGEPR